MLTAIIEFRLQNFLIFAVLFGISAFLSGWGWSSIAGRERRRWLCGFIFIMLGSVGASLSSVIYFLYNHIAW